MNESKFCLIHDNGYIAIYGFILYSHDGVRRSNDFYVLLYIQQSYSVPVLFGGYENIHCNLKNIYLPDKLQLCFLSHLKLSELKDLMDWSFSLE
jgi:hypothetical protein